MSNEPKQYILLRKLLQALSLSDGRIDELIATIQSWLADDKEEPDKPQFPYQLREDFLSPAELNFYRVLQTAVADWATLFTKVNLADLFYASVRDSGQNQAYRNRINRKHLDFLLCDPNTYGRCWGLNWTTTATTGLTVRRETNLWMASLPRPDCRCCIYPSATATPRISSAHFYGEKPGWKMKPNPQREQKKPGRQRPYPIARSAACQ